MLRSKVAAAAMIVLACACSSPGMVDEPASTTTIAVTTTAPEVVEVALPTYRGFAATHPHEGTLVAILGEEIPVYGSPHDAEPKLTAPRTTVLGTTTVLTTTGPPEGGWVEVMLPMRPNGSTGWVPVSEIALYVVDGRIEVDLSDRELVYFLDGREVLRSAVAVGTARNPTPPGAYFVTDNITITRSSGPWGPAALGLSARSDTITEFNGGDGIIGIHGTNRPGSIGQAASLGCVRLPNDVILELAAMVPIGTPVEIRE